MDTILFFLECLGAVSFALSGILVAIERKADAVGAFVMAMTTAFGGGITRDLLLGRTPPTIFTDRSTQIQAIIALVISMFCYLLSFKPKTAKIIDRHKNDFFLNLFDAIGLGIFCVVGVDIAMSEGYGDGIFLPVFMGCITGVGGGILRDMFANTLPMVFRKHIYMLPALIGSIIYVFAIRWIPKLPAMLISMIFIIAVRILASRYKWNLPVPGNSTKAEAENSEPSVTTEEAPLVR